MVLFSAKDLKSIAAEIRKRQTFESTWTDEQGNEIEIKQDGLSPVDKVQQGIDIFVDEIMRRFYEEPRNDKEISYYSEDTPRLTE